ncbi:MAG: phenylalanine--tRNA ligase subunit beta-related protein, partial [Planctomycetota bacterium]
RPIRGAIERVATIICGHDVRVDVVPGGAPGWLEPGATLLVNGETLGCLGVVAPAVAAQFELSGRLLGAELDLPRLYDRYPPDAEAHALPSFPDIERDLSVVIDEKLAWQQLREAIDELDLDCIEAVEYVTTFRGRQVGAGRKSLTCRLRFRAPDRTLRHEEVDPQVDAVVATLEKRFDATLRQ